MVKYRLLIAFGLGMLAGVLLWPVRHDGNVAYAEAVDSDRTETRRLRSHHLRRHLLAHPLDRLQHVRIRRSEGILEPLARVARGPGVLAVQGGERRIDYRTDGRIEQIKVRIPPGIEKGGKLRVTGKGGPHPSGGAPGDLYLQIDIEPDPIFTRDGNDLQVRAECRS